MKWPEMNCPNTPLSISFSCHHFYLADQTYLLQAQHSKGRNESSNQSVKKRWVWLGCGADEVMGERHIPQEAAVEECLSHLHGHVSPGGSQLKFQPRFKGDLRVECRKLWQCSNIKAIQKTRSENDKGNNGWLQNWPATTGITCSILSLTNTDKRMAHDTNTNEILSEEKNWRTWWCWTPACY